MGDSNVTQTFLRVADVTRVTGLPRSTIYEMAERGAFPKQVRLSPRAVAWLESEILDWQRARIAERAKSEDARTEGPRSRRSSCTARQSAWQ